MTADLGLAELLTGAQSPEDMRRAVHGLLLERLSRDPSFAALAPLLSSRAAPTEAPPVPKTDGFISGDTHSPISDLLREASAAAAAEESRVRGLLAEVASALGACTRCLGTDKDCTRCEGLGNPGCVVPSAAPYARWVAPVVSRFAEVVPAKEGATDEKAACKEKATESGAQNQN